MTDSRNTTSRDLAELYLVEVHEQFDKSTGIPSYFTSNI